MLDPALGVGLGLDAIMNRRSIQVIANSLNKRAQEGPTTVNIFQWVRYEVLLALTEGVYGPKNLFRDLVMEEAWYTFEPAMMIFLLNLFPRLFVRKSFKAREYMVKAWERYFDEGFYEQGSELIKACVRINKDFNILLKETAKIEYFLKKGSTIIIPSSVHHTNRAIWGKTVETFLHKRFIRESRERGINATAFRAFGGGTTLCPGRHFAATEILMFSALLVLRFDIEPIGGKWIAPSTAKSPVVPALPFPDWDFPVEIRPRDDCKPWIASFSGYEKGMEIAAEDIGGATPDLDDCY
ncbi:cytochrome P450 [Xylaria telfairii]|nr:cytochrome P450 [Xylaria telfairii]